MSMDFLGKWSLGTADGHYVGIDPATNRLNVTASALGVNQKFNAYGETGGFMLQAANGRYVRSTADGYVADLDRNGAVSYFALEDAGSGQWRIVDLGVKGGGTTLYYWDDQGGELKAIAKSSAPPATTGFRQTIITVGLAVFKERGFPTPKPDLSWVYLADADLSDVMLSQADLSHADLSRTNLSGVPLPTANLSGALLIGAKMTGMTDLTNADLTGADLTGADMTDIILNKAKLTGATLTGAKMPGAALNNTTCTTALMQNTDLSNGFITKTDFTGADLTGAIFTTAVVRSINLTDANLTGARMSNANLTNPTIDLTDATISAKTNFTRAKMQYVDLSGHDLQHVDMAYTDLTGSRLDRTILSQAELSYADLTSATLTGSIAMHGTNFANATLTGADLTGAQMGSISLLFRVTDPTSVTNFKNALNAGDVAAVKAIFLANGITLPATVIIEPSPYAPGRVWDVRTDQTVYTVRLEQVSGADTMGVYDQVTAAILTNAFMKGAILTSANLYNVRASGVQLYGGAKLDGNTILERAQFDNANLGNINLKQANLYGANLDYAVLTNAQFQGADLSLDAGGGQTSLERANLQGADFSDAVLDDAIFTDAAVSVLNEVTAGTDGVWLFSATATDTLLAEIRGATQQFNLDMVLLPYLQPGTVQQPIRIAFQDQGITLGAGALVTVQASGPSWTLADGATTYAINEGCDLQTYQPALAVQKGSSATLLFTLPLSLEKDLVSGPADDAVRAAFLKNGVTLGSDARVTAFLRATDWQIVDTAATYAVWLGIDESCNFALTVRPVMPNVTETFSNHSTPLGRRATVAAAGDDRWQIDNDSNNPYNPVTNYIRFTVINNKIDGMLDIFGAAMRVLRAAAAGQMEYHNIRCDATVLSQDVLTDSTVCPNSLRTEVNKKDHIPFKKWMRAKELPKAPSCVPSADGYYYCPVSGSAGFTENQTE